MGELTLSGVLSRPISGEVVANARISFDAVATGTVVLKGVSSVCKTAIDGTYSVDLQYGDYAIQVSWSGQTQQYGVIHIDSTTPIGDLNTLLLQNIMEQQVTPEIILEFRQLEQQMQEDLAQMEQLNTEATSAASAASLSEQNAATSEANAATHEGAAAGSATAAGQSATASASSASAADASQKKASTSEVNAATSEDNAAISERNAATSEDNAAISAGEAATSQVAASVSEVNSSANAGAAGSSATSASKSASAASASEINSKTSETNAANSSNAAGEYAQEAKDAASKVTDPLTDQGTWAIQSGYPAVPGVASIWQIIDGGVDPSNPEIIWDAGDLLVYLASSGAWCRMLGQQVVSGEPVPLRFDSDIVLAKANLQFVTSSTTIVNAVGLASDNSLVLGDGDTPNICFLASAPTNMFVLVPDGNGGYTKSRIYTEAFPPPSTDTSHFVPDSRKVNGHVLTADVNIVPGDITGLGTAATHNVQTSPIDVTAGSMLLPGAFGWGGVSIATVTTSNSDLHKLPGMTFNAVREYVSSDGSVYLIGISGLSSNGNLAEWLAPENGADGTKVAVRNKTTLFTLYSDMNPPPYPVMSVNGKTGAVTSFPTTKQQYGGNNPTQTDLNLMTTNSVAFCYPDNSAGGTPAYNTPNTSGGVIMFSNDEFSGYAVQLHSGYSTKRFGYRTHNGDTKTWNEWTYVYDSANPPPAPNLSAYIKTTDADAKFVQSVEFGSQGSMSISPNGGTATVPAGCSVTGLKTVTSSGSGISTIYYKPIQKNINGTWTTISG